MSEISVSYLDWTIPGKKMIYSPEQERERALRALQLNSGSDLDYSGGLLAASSKKPAIRIKRLSFDGPNSFKLKGACLYRRKGRKQKKH